jgi:Omp85 superfamily domain
VMAVASAKFKSGGLRTFMFGKNYRKEWKTPVKVKVLNMETEYGGLTPTKMGGGHQTKSLRLTDKNGKEYVLRQIEKNVTDAALPPELRGLTVANDVISDGVSASYPYAALSIPPLAEAAGVPHANPTLVFVPKDPLLGLFINDFANSFCLLEERSPNGNDKTISTDKMEKELFEDNDNTIDQKAALQARLLDMFVMDFDRHEDQWRWAAVDNGKGKTFYPLPRDRDQPFFINSGVIPYFVGRPSVTPQIQGFRSKARHINSYNFNAKNFDRNYMNELNRDDWQQAAATFINLMTDQLLEKALHLQPQEIQLYSMQRIINKLKKRKLFFVDEMMHYYNFLSKTVTIFGSNKKELFDVERHDDESVIVTVFKVSKNGEMDKKIYERKFLQTETKEIRLHGLEGSDKFNLHGNGIAKIAIRIIGGAGKDEFDIETATAAGKTKIYDLATEENTITGKGHYKNLQSSNPTVNAFGMRDYKYNIFAPFISAAYNPDDGLYLGLSLKYTKQGFRKKPFAQQHQFAASHSLATNAYKFNYSLRATDVFKETDLLLQATLNAPNNTTNFFTYGNESVYNKNTATKIEYYRARFVLADVQLSLQKKLNSKFAVEAGPVFQYYGFDSADNKGRLINLTNINGLNAATLNKTKTYAGFQVKAILDNRNNKFTPSRGIKWQTGYTAYEGLGKYSNNYGQLNSDMSFFISFNKKATVVIANRLGGGISFGNIEFYQAQYLSGTDNLRGYRKYRFSGTKMLYHNLDLRIKLADFKTYFFPGSLGLLAFHDIGRVWIKNDSSKKWHQGYGGGIWIAPLSRFVITGGYGYGDDGGLPAVSFGFQF